MAFLALLLLFSVHYTCIADGTSSSGPCTEEALAAGLYHHPYPPDPTKYIQCEWGTYHIRDCPTGTWDDVSSTCTDYAHGMDGQAVGAMPQDVESGPVQTHSTNTEVQVDPVAAGSGSRQLYLNHRGQHLPEQQLPQDGDPRLWFGAGADRNKWAVQPERRQDGNPSQWLGTNGSPGYGDQVNLVNGQMQNSHSLANSKSVDSHMGNGQTQSVPSGAKGYQQWVQKSRKVYTGGRQSVPSTQNGMSTGNRHGAQSQAWSVQADSNNVQSTGMAQSGQSVPQSNQQIHRQMTRSQSTSSQSSYGMAHSKGTGKSVSTVSTGHQKSMATGQTSGSYKSHSTQKSGSNKSYKSTFHSQKSMKSTNGVDTSLQNPCSDPNRKFIMDPTTPFKYYACVNGQPQARDCPADSVWIQSAQECRSLKPDTGSGSGSGIQHPCSGSVRFLPYPGDRTLYIECVGPHRQEIRKCPAHLVWSQDQLTCVRLEWGQGPQVPPTVTAPPQPQVPGIPSDVPDSFCLNTDSFYHPYPPDTSKFVQCDEFGNMYLRYCGPGKRWDKMRVTCTGSHEMASGETADASYGKSDHTLSPQQGNREQGSKHMDESYIHAATKSDMELGKVNTEDTPEPFLCPQGTQWMENLVRCSGGSLNQPHSSDCPGGMVWLQAVHGCLNLSAGVSLFNSVTPINCPQRYMYDAASGECHVASVSGGDTAGTSGNPDCSKDYEWDMHLQMCIKRLTPELFLNALKPDPTDPVLNIKGPNTYANVGMARTNEQGTMMYGDSNGQYMASTNTNPDSVPVQINEIPEYTGPNPCVGEELYHPYPSDRRYFIQCDLDGRMHVRACSYGQVWEQDMLTCVTWSVLLNAPDQGIGAMAGAGKEAPDNMDPCKNSKRSHHKFPFNNFLYVSCMGEYSQVMPCPPGLVWDDRAETCDRPSAVADQSDNDDGADDGEPYLG